MTKTAHWTKQRCGDCQFAIPRHGERRDRGLDCRFGPPVLTGGYPVVFASTPACSQFLNEEDE